MTLEFVLQHNAALQQLAGNPNPDEMPLVNRHVFRFFAEPWVPGPGKEKVKFLIGLEVNTDLSDADGQRVVRVFYGVGVQLSKLFPSVFSRS